MRVEYRKQAMHWLVALWICAGILLSVLGWHAVRSGEEHALHHDVRLYGNERTAAFNWNLRDNVAVLDELAALYAASRHVDREEFAAFSEHIFDHRPSVQFMGWVPRVTHTERPGYERARQASGHRGFRILDRMPEGKVVTAGEREEYWPLEYLIAQADVPVSVGYDLSAEPSIAETFSMAVDRGDRVATRRVALLDSEDAAPQLLVVAPVYAKDSARGVIGEARATPLGLLVAVLRIDTVLENALATLRPQGLDVYLLDDTAAGNEAFIYVHSSKLRDTPIVPRNIGELTSGDFHHADVSEFAGQRWRLVFVPTRGVVAAHRSAMPWLMLFGGLAVTVALAAYMQVIHDRTSRLSQFNAELAEAHEHTQRSEARLRQIIDLVPHMIFAKDREGRFLLANRAVATAFGASVEELVDARRQDLHPRRNEAWSMLADDQLVIDTGDQLVIPNERFTDASGAERILETIKVPYVADDGTPAVLGIAVDITERTRVKEELSSSFQRYRSVVEASRNVIVVLDENCRILEWNAAAEHLYGYNRDQVLGKNYVELCVPSEVQRDVVAEIERVLAGGTTEGYENPVQTRTGDQRMVVWNSRRLLDQDGRLLGLVAIGDDITDKKEAEDTTRRLEAELRQSQKMEAIGVLAGGIAHDFNNLLAAMIGYTELALGKAGGHERLVDNLQQVLDAGDHATKLVKQILAFSRKQEYTAVPVEMPDLVGSALDLIEASLPSMIEIRKNIDLNAGVVVADETDIHQIVMNLCTNAYQAIGDTSGVLSVTLAAVDVDERLANERLHLNAGRYIKFTVSDTGCGIEEEIKQRVFEPFFTTKPVGQGTGLGLSVVHGIVTRYGGAVDLRSAPGEGTVIDVYLPKAGRDPASAAAGEQELALEGTERVLLVDDEQRLINMAGQMLEQLGYNVTGVASSTKALALFRQQPQSFDIVITDQAMPEMTGVELAKELTRIRANIPIIIATGFSTVVRADNAEALGMRGYINKPYRPHELGHAVRKALSSRLAA